MPTRFVSFRMATPHGHRIGFFEEALSMPSDMNAAMLYDNAKGTACLTLQACSGYKEKSPLMPLPKTDGVKTSPFLKIPGGSAFRKDTWQSSEPRSFCRAGLPLICLFPLFSHQGQDAS